MEFSKRHWRKLDWTLLGAVIVLIALGMMVVYSASSSRLNLTGDDPLHFVKRQALFTVAGFFIMVLMISIDYRLLRRMARLLYLANSLLLVGVLIYGHTAFGSQRWFRLGTFSLQPSELAKIAIIVALARLLENSDNFRDYRLAFPFVLVALPMTLIVLQPDVGTSIVFLGILFSMLYLAGANSKHLTVIGTTGLGLGLGAVVVSAQGWLPIIKPYQITRLLVFLDPYADRTRAGWNVIQSMIAVGSGGFLGKGLMSGTQSQLNFLPANHTDFVFSVVAEEFGFVGSILVLSLYLLIIWRGITIASRAKERFGMLLAAGCVSMFFFHLLINVGMSLGMMPVTGLPLPFITYGGSNLLPSMCAIGILLNIGLRRHKIMF